MLAAKIAVAAALIAWLVRSGTLDFGALKIFYHRPALLVASLAVYAFTVVLGALRWRLLLRLAEVHLSVGRALQLMLTGMFFNVALPGNIGGDVIRSVYVAREAPREKRATIYVIALLDRLLALVGLIGVACVLTLARGHAVWDSPQLRDLAIAVLVLTAATFGGPILLLVVVRRLGSRLDGWTGGASRIGKVFAQIVAAVRLIAANPKTLVGALGLAVCIHLAGIILFAVLATAITGQDIAVSTLASVYPLGMLTLVLPISYAGFGVGHVAFDQLFALVGLTGGATVLNAYLISQIVPCLCGVIPYLTLRRQAAPIDSEIDAS